MRLVELLLIRTLLWFGLPVLLLLLAVGPQRLWQGITAGLRWAFGRRPDPERTLGEIVRQQQDRVVRERKMLAQAEMAEAGIVGSLQTSEANGAKLAGEARALVTRDDDAGARAALYKLNLERMAADGFRRQLDQQRQWIADARRRLYVLELQLRQYEVGRSVLLCQLAQAQSLEEQYKIAHGFDPSGVIAEWRRTEELVERKAVSAKAADPLWQEKELACAGITPSRIDPRTLDAQLAQLRAEESQKVGAA
jgi:phage shock protein A